MQSDNPIIFVLEEYAAATLSQCFISLSVVTQAGYKYSCGVYIFKLESSAFGCPLIQMKTYIFPFIHDIRCKH